MKYSIFALVLLVALITPVFASDGWSIDIGGNVCNAPEGCNVPPSWSGKIPPNTIVSGDVRANGQPLYDTLETSGLILVATISATQPITISAEWGAYIRPYETVLVGQMLSDMLATGCGDRDNDGQRDGCQTVDIIDATSWKKQTFNKGM